jgi:hypothetical protein
MKPRIHTHAWLYLFLFLGIGALGGTAAAQAPPPIALPKASELSEPQNKAIEAILADAKAKVAPITAELGKGVRQVRENLLSRKVDEAARQQILGRISSLAAQLVALRINTTARILGVLTAEQKDLVDSEEKKVDFNLDVYEVLVKLFGLPRMS